MTISDLRPGEIFICQGQTYQKLPRVQPENWAPFFVNAIHREFYEFAWLGGKHEVEVIGFEPLEIVDGKLRIWHN